MFLALTRIEIEIQDGLTLQGFITSCSQVIEFHSSTIFNLHLGKPNPPIAS